jgi:hypothetical protein
VSHATKTTGDPIYLYAFDPETVVGGSMQQLLVTEAGSGNSNIVPVVANGEVFVASHKQLEIFGILPPRKK